MAPPARTSTATSESAFTISGVDDKMRSLDIKFEGHVNESGVTKYIIRVTGPHGSHVVHRRYNEFDQLHNEMFGHSVQTTEAAAAAMPPKSFWRKNFSKDFQVSREQQLEGVATSAVQAAADTNIDACPPALRRFLGLDDACVPTASAKQTPRPSTRELDSEPAVAEKEQESLMQKAQDMLHKVEQKVEHAAEEIEQKFSHREKENAVSASSSDTGHSPAEPEPEAVVKDPEDQPATPANTETKDQPSVLEKMESKLHDVFHKVEDNPALKDSENQTSTPANTETKDQPSVLERIESKLHDALHKVEDGVQHLEQNVEAMVEAPSKPKPRLPAIYKMTKKPEGSIAKGHYYRTDKLPGDPQSHVSDKLQEWGSYVVGVDEGDGFLRVDGLGYLPLKWGLDLVVVPAPAPLPKAMYTLSHDYYECTNHSSGCGGLRARKSKMWGDFANGKSANFAWGTVLCGEDQGDGWLKFGNYFLPMTIDDSPVMIVKELKRMPRGACFAVCCH